MRRALAFIVGTPIAASYAICTLLVPAWLIATTGMAPDQSAGYTIDFVLHRVRQVKAFITSHRLPADEHPELSLGFSEAEPEWLEAGTTRLLQVTEPDPDSVAMSFRSHRAYLHAPTYRRVKWSLLDATDGVTLSGAAGRLEIARTVPDGTRFRVAADVERGRWTLVGAIVVFTSAARPLARSWSETFRIRCEDGARVTQRSSIDELIFRPGGRFSVTRAPFESRKDYWGTYDAHGESGHITMHVDGGNAVPPDVAGDGTFAIHNGELTLQGIWLGTAEPGEPRACGHVFR
jgi:hypothetical protein